MFYSGLFYPAQMRPMWKGRVYCDVTMACIATNTSTLCISGGCGLPVRCVGCVEVQAECFWILNASKHSKTYSEASCIAGNFSAGPTDPEICSDRQIQVEQMAFWRLWHPLRHWGWIRRSHNENKTSSQVSIMWFSSEVMSFCKLNVC